MSSIFELAGQLYEDPVFRERSAALPANTPLDYRELATILVEYWRQRNCELIGLGGGQGAGKSTLASLLQAAAAVVGERLVVLSIDDFYLTRQERQQLAATKQALFATRGPPGTHAIERLRQVVEELRDGCSVTIPKFDKGLDDRVGSIIIEGECDRVLVEGWCVGAVAQPNEQLKQPINDLERVEDTDGAWRRCVNEYLAGEYAQLTHQFQSLVFLRVPNMVSVRQWRLQQELNVAPELRRDAQWVARFVQYYQRVTEWMWEDVEPRADVCVKLDERHRIQALRLS